MSQSAPALGAIWDNDDEQWVLPAPRDERGRLDGVRKVWREDGSLFEEAKSEAGREVYLRRYHPDGVLAFERLFDQRGMPVSNLNVASGGETDLKFPNRGLDPSIVKTMYVYSAHGYIEEWTGWNEAGAIVASERPNRSLDGATPQTTYASVEEASAEWNRLGAVFYQGLNAFIGKHYVGVDGDAESEESDQEEDADAPEDGRAHMERYVLEAVEALNKEGRAARARELFHPAFEPISDAVWGSLGQRIQRVAFVAGAVLVQAGDVVARVVGEQIAIIEGCFAFGVSRDRKLVAVLGDAGVEVRRGLDGAFVRRFDYPKSYEEQLGAMPTLAGPVHPHDWTFNEVIVANDGRFVVISTDRGVFVLGEHGAKLVFPRHEAMAKMAAEQEPEKFVPAIRDPRAALSLDETVLVVSGRWDTAEDFTSERYLLDLDAQGRVLGERQHDTFHGPFGPAHFHSNGAHFLLTMVEPPQRNFFSSSPAESYVFTLDAKRVLGDRDGLLENQPGTHSMRSDVVHSAGELDDQFLVGMGDCYLWVQGINANTQQFVFLGGRGQLGGVTAVDFDPETRELLAGTEFGAVWRLQVPTTLQRLEQPSDRFLTNLNVTDQRRYLFLKTYAPMVW